MFMQNIGYVNVNNINKIWTGNYSDCCSHKNNLFIISPKPFDAFMFQQIGCGHFQ